MKHHLDQVTANDLIACIKDIFTNCDTRSECDDSMLAFALLRAMEDLPPDAILASGLCGYATDFVGTPKRAVRLFAQAKLAQKARQIALRDGISDFSAQNYWVRPLRASDRI